MSECQDYIIIQSNVVRQLQLSLGLAIECLKYGPASEKQKMLAINTGLDALGLMRGKIYRYDPDYVPLLAELTAKEKQHD